MQVYKVYFKIIKKQLFSILIYGVLFLAITIVVSANRNKVNSNQFKSEKVPILVVNEDGQNSLLEGFLKYMDKYVIFEEVEDTENARSDALFFQKVLYILTIPEGFTKAFLAGDKVSLQKQIIPDSIAAISVDDAVNNYFNTATIYLKSLPKLSNEELKTFVELSLSKETEVSFDVMKEKVEVNPNIFNVSFYNSLGYIIIVCFIIGVSTVMISFHSIEIQRKLHASPLTARSMNIQLIFANFTFVMCYLLTFLIAGFLCNPYRRVDTAMVLYWVNAFAFSLAALSVSYLIGITIKSKKAISAISTALSLSLAFISGMFVPQELLGKSVLKVASFTPAYWFVKANNTIVYLNDFHWKSIQDIFGYMAIQIGFAAAIIAVALVVSKRKSQQA